MEITNSVILTAITDLSGFVKKHTEDMVEVKRDIAGMKEDISGIRQEMQLMNKKIDGTHDLAI